MVLRRAADAPTTEPAARRPPDLAGPAAAARQLQRLVGQRASAIHLAAVADLDDLDKSSCVVDRVDDSVCPLANAITLGVSGELLAAAWTRILCKRPNAKSDSDADRTGLDRLELLGGGGLDEEAIACHVAEGP
jgi:hypothetical protein